MSKIKVQEIAMKAAGVSGGVVAAKLLNKVLPNMNPKIRGAAKILIGAVGPSFIPKMKMAEHVGTGFMAMGAAELIDDLVPAISGADDVLAGPGEAVVIDEDYEQVSGADDEDEVMAGIGEGDDDDDEE